MTAARVVKRTKTVLAESPRNGVYLLPSMRTVLLRVDVLEFSVKDKVDATEGQEVFADVLVLETVWEYVKRQDLGPTTGSKKVALPRGYENDDTTEVCRESDTDRNERAVATAWKWYANNLKELRPDDARVLFLSHDAEDLKRAEKYGVTGGRTIAEFLEPVIAKFPELQNLLSISTAEEKELKAEG
ncbi:putative exosome complex exonuclease RRP44 [Phytophthora cinnamomi]|uniref:putative exosome complex exonuclease RRP44 n=1 Tax=Phytophthora cinnamomi TaxID=4785 RepID=UPI00355A64C2|nr:putative exosome complex exonuclease RRP44 [Phytophthora cinnamomi]